MDGLLFFEAIETRKMQYMKGASFFPSCSLAHPSLHEPTEAEGMVLHRTPFFICVWVSLNAQTFLWKKKHSMIFSFPDWISSEHLGVTSESAAAPTFTAHSDPR